MRSSRQIERRCTEDLAFRVLAGNEVPDHVTIARFRVRHQHALAGFLVESLRLCAAAGLVRLGMVALDGTKVAANAADRANRTLAKLQEEVDQILRQAAEIDQAEDHQQGRALSEELPAELASPTGRLARLQQAKAHWRPRRPNASAGMSSAWPTWSPPPAPAASSPRRTSSRGAGTRHPAFLAECRRQLLPAAEADRGDGASRTLSGRRAGSSRSA